jgi:hypothetical protein
MYGQRCFTCPSIFCSKAVIRTLRGYDANEVGVFVTAALA